MKYAWIDAQCRGYRVPDTCEVLAVRISGYRTWRRGGKPDRARLTDPGAVAPHGSIGRHCAAVQREAVEQAREVATQTQGS